MFHDSAENQPAETLRARSAQLETRGSQTERMDARLAELNTTHSIELRRLHHVAREAHDNPSTQLPPSDHPNVTGPTMSPGQKRFYASEQCSAARAALQELVDSPLYNTDSDYYSSNERDFVDRHLHILSAQQKPNLQGYLSNLKLMTRIRSR